MGELGEHPTEEKPLPTIWRVPDELWERIEPILQEHDPPKKRLGGRASISAPLWTRLSSGFAPAASGTASPASSPTIHRCIVPSRGGSNLGVLDRIWAALVEECEELGRVD